MPLKIFAGLLAIVLMLAYLLPMLFKLKSIALGAVILIGLTMMLVDLWQSLKSGEE
jgi:tetrahydromethanopterin S-methyltransferase subunit D